MMNALRDTRGQVSLVGTLVAATLGLTALMGTMSLFKVSSRAQRTVQSRAEAMDLNTSLRMILDNPALCKKAFWDSEKTPQIASFNPENPNLDADRLPISIHFGDASLLYRGSKPDPSITVTSITFAEIDQTVRTSTASTTTYLASLTVALSWDGNLAYRGPSSISLPLYIQTDKFSRIVSCGTNLSAGTTTVRPSPTPAPAPRQGLNIFSGSATPSTNPPAFASTSTITQTLSLAASSLVSVIATATSNVGFNSGGTAFFYDWNVFRYPGGAQIGKTGIGEYQLIMKIHYGTHGKPLQTLCAVNQSLALVAEDTLSVGASCNAALSPGIYDFQARLYNGTETLPSYYDLAKVTSFVLNYSVGY